MVNTKVRALTTCTIDNGVWTARNVADYTHKRHIFLEYNTKFKAIHEEEEEEEFNHTVPFQA